MTLKKYRLIDITIFTFFAIFAEIVGVLALRRYSGAGFYMSFGVMISIIAMIRWGISGAFVYIFSSIPMIFILDYEILHGILYFPIANSFIVLSTLLFLVFKRDYVVKNKLLFLLFEVLAFIGISVGKGFANYLNNGEFIKFVLAYFISQLYCIIMTGIFLALISKREGLIVNMDKYVISMRTEVGKDDVSR